MRKRLVASVVLLGVLMTTGARGNYERVSVGNIVLGVATGKISGGSALAVAYSYDDVTVRVSGSSVSPEVATVQYYACILVIRSGYDLGCGVITAKQFTFDQLFDGAKLSFSVKSMVYSGKKLSATVTLVQNGTWSPDPWIDPPLPEALPRVYGEALAGAIRPARVSGSIRSDVHGGGSLQPGSQTYGYMYRGVGGSFYVDPS